MRGSLAPATATLTAAIREDHLHDGKMGAGGSSEASVPGAPGAAGPAGPAGGGAQWGALVVLLFLGLLVAYCCWGAPCCRGCCCRPRRGPPAAAAHHRSPHPQHRPQDMLLPGVPGVAGGVPGVPVVCSPTIILLPQGRMLVVDGSVLSSLQADASGLDLIRLGENLVRAQRRQDSTILDAEAGLAGLARLTDLAGRKEGRPLDGGPPTYEELFGLERERPSSAPCPSPPLAAPPPPSAAGLQVSEPKATGNPPRYDELQGHALQHDQQRSPDNHPEDAVVLNVGDQSMRESRV